MARLSMMMFLEYVIWGSWLPLLALYLGDVLGFSGSQIGWIFATPAIACVVAFFVGGQLADRVMSTEKLLAVLHVVGGVAMLALAFQTTFWAFFVIMLVVPTGLHPDDVADQCDRVSPCAGRAEGFRPHSTLGHDRVDCRQLAVRLHPRRQDR